MPIDATLVRRLVAEQEGTALDFKGDHYQGPNARYELAKDVMAMANARRVGAAPAYILVGVEERPDHTGKVVGVPPASHPDDATLHQQVHAVLNKTPDFAYLVTEAEDDAGVRQSVGVIEIRPGGRPYYPLESQGTRLQRLVALYRDGSSTLVASPTRILEWAEEDDVLGRDARAAEIDFHRAQTAVRVHLRRGSCGGEGDRTLFECFVENHGVSPFTVTDAAARWRLRRSFLALLASANRLPPPPDEPPGGGATVVAPDSPLVVPGHPQKYRVTVPIADVQMALRSIRYPERAHAKVVEAMLLVTAEGPSGRAVTKEIQLHWPES